jgi:ribosomal protein L17
MEERFHLITSSVSMGSEERRRASIQYFRDPQQVSRTFTDLAAIITFNRGDYLRLC